jgi:DNA-binding CsgD family transcriptional regulator
MRPRKPADLGLTGRQLDVLELMMTGKSNKAICRKLNRAEPTVKNHVTAILKTLKVMNRTEAVIAVSSLIGSGRLRNRMRRDSAPHSWIPDEDEIRT